MESCGHVSWEDLLEGTENWSGCEPDSCALKRVVPDVTDVLKNRIWTDTQEEMRYEDSPVKAHTHHLDGNRSIER